MVRRQVGRRLRQHASSRVETDAGLAGYGEVCPLGPFYLPAYAEGVRAGHRASSGRTCSARTRASSTQLNRRMDAALKGHPYVKSGIDIACWDILGQAAGLPVCTLLGGRYGDDFVLYRAISQESPDAMAAKVAGYRAEGYRRFQLKVGGDPDVDIARIRAVARGARSRATGSSPTPTPAGCMHEAMRVVRAVRDVDVYIEQPCLTLRGVPVGPPAHRPPVRAGRERSTASTSCCARTADLAMDVVNLKISKLGGLTKARQARDLCVSLGIAMTIED